MTTLRPTGLIRRGTTREVTNVELFFDLVYVFAVTQLSHVVVEHPSATEFLHAVILLAMVWQVWVYTAWSTNYLDPSRTPVRGILLVLMAGSLVLAALIPEAFETRGLVVAIAYSGMQLVREVFEIWATRGDELQAIFRRVIVWSSVTAVPMVVGGCVHGHAREALWIVAVAADLIGSGTGFRVPGMGRSATTDWTISGAHFAERCQAFVLIALGESVVVIGGLAHFGDNTTGHDVAAFVAAFAGAVGLWWIYFDRSADDSAREIEATDDPGRLARNAFHWLHPVIVAGIIVTAAADERVLHDPIGTAHLDTVWFIAGGVALFLIGHAAFKAMVWRIVPWSRLAGAAVLLACVPLGRHVSGLTFGVIALVVIVVIAVLDRLSARGNLVADDARLEI